MSEIVSSLLQWLNANPHLAGLATFIISAAESIAIIGTIVPGTITMTAIGTLAGAGIIPLWSTLIWAMLGAIAGDGISYWLGHYFKDRLRNAWPFKSNPQLLLKGELFVNKYGIMSVFIGRFVGPVRALVPLVAGMLGMKPLQFTIANITSAIGWAPAYMLPGILLGAASLELPADIAVHAIIAVFLIILFIALCLWLVYKIFQLARMQIEQFLNWIWRSLQQSRHFHLATNVLKHYDRSQHHGQLTLAFYFILCTFLLFLLCCYVKTVGAGNIGVNEVVYHLFRGIRSHHADTIMLSISLLGQKQIILPVVAVIFLWLLFTRRMRTAIHVLALGVLAAGSVYLIKHLIQSPRPWGIFQSPESYSMPSGHTTLATTVYLGIAFIICTTIHSKKRWLIYTPASLVALAVGISRIYLGAHWLTDVLAAWLLSAALLIIVILSYHRYREKPISILGISLISFISLFISYSIYYHTHFAQLQINHAQISQPTLQIPMKAWWKKEGHIPARRVSFFGFPSQYINLVWNGSLEQIKNELIKAGWKEPPKRNWISTLHRVADIQSGDYLPLISPQYLDKRPVLILSKRVNGKKRLLVLRLYASDRMVKDTNEPLWVGTVGTIPRSYSWIFRNHHDIDMHAKYVLRDQTGFSPWESRVVIIPVNHGSRTEKILLVRKKK